jgi:hypothetical protein
MRKFLFIVNRDSNGLRPSLVPLNHHHNNNMALQPKSGPGLPFLVFLNNNLFAGLLLVQRPTPNLQDQASVFMTPGDRVVQLYPQALGNHFSRLLRHAWVTVRLFFNPGHHTGTFTYPAHLFMETEFVSIVFINLSLLVLSSWFLTYFSSLASSVTFVAVQTTDQYKTLGTLIFSIH